jgi:DNA-directed RNA polymerase beta subunit
VNEDMIEKRVTPHECRLRDMSYAAPVYVDVKYTKGNTVVPHKNLMIGRIPIMLRSSKCGLRGRIATAFETAELRHQVDLVASQQQCIHQQARDAPVS